MDFGINEVLGIVSAFGLYSTGIVIHKAVTYGIINNQELRKGVVQGCLKAGKRAYGLAVVDVHRG